MPRPEPITLEGWIDDWFRLMMGLVGGGGGREAEGVSLNVHYSLKDHDSMSLVGLFPLEIQVSQFFCVKMDRADSPQHSRFTGAAFETLRGSPRLLLLTNL